MSLTERPPEVNQLCRRLHEIVAPYVGRVEYGNLRSRVSEWDCPREGPVTNIALVYETPGGSTDQINVCFHHSSLQFSLVDEQQGEVRTDDIDRVLELVLPRVSCIPQKRLQTLMDEIVRLMENGSNTAGLMGHLTRLVQSEFKGGSITHLEMRDAMTFAVKYMNDRKKGAAGNGEV